MTKKTTLSKDVKKLLIAGRNRYDNKMLQIEKLWFKLKKTYYSKREAIINIVNKMIKIDEDVKVWETTIS